MTLSTTSGDAPLTAPTPERVAQSIQRATRRLAELQEADGRVGDTDVGLQTDEDDRFPTAALHRRPDLRVGRQTDQLLAGEKGLNETGPVEGQGVVDRGAAEVRHHPLVGRLRPRRGHAVGHIEARQRVIQVDDFDPVYLTRERDSWGDNKQAGVAGQSM